MTLRVDPGLKDLVRRQLTERAAPSPEQLNRAVTTIRSKALFDLQFKATVEGHSFVSDEREEAGGHDAGPAPLRYLLAGVMMCHQVWCVKTASLDGVQIDRLECEISGYLERPSGAAGTADGRGFGRAAYTVYIDSPNPEHEVQAVVDQATRRCPAFVTFQRASRVDLSLVHNGKKTFEKAYEANT